MKRYLPTIGSVILLLILFSCRSKTIYTSADSRFETPPGTFRLHHNFYADHTEMTNLGYLEFLWWTKRVYGTNATEYLELQPDSTVWMRLGSSYQSLDTFYLRHPAYMDYPVVGISYKQALLYSKWRSDRVMESILVREKVFKWALDTSPVTAFTIEKYFTGKFRGIKPDPRIIYYPSYSLPDSNSFYKILAFNESLLSSSSKRCKRSAFTSDRLCPGRFQYTNVHRPYGPLPLLPVADDDCKYKFISHLKGNVREMTNVEGVFYGCSFKDSCEMNPNVCRRDSNLVNCFTGFRNICTFKRWGEQ